MSVLHLLKRSFFSPLLFSWSGGNLYCYIWMVYANVESLTRKSPKEAFVDPEIYPTQNVPTVSPLSLMLCGSR